MTDSRRLSRRDLFLGRFLQRAAEPRVPRSAPVGTVPGADPAASSAASPRSAYRSFPLHRPPSALPEDDFLAACTRCGDCAAACPHHAIAPAPARLRMAERTPIIQPMLAPCRMCPDLPCVAACAPRALRPAQPVRMAEAQIETWACLAHNGSFCTVCSEHCPVPNAIVLTAGRPTIDPAHCTGCGVCQHVCPAPANAVLLMPLAERPLVPVGPEPHGGSSSSGNETGANETGEVGNRGDDTRPPDAGPAP